MGLAVWWAEKQNAVLVGVELVVGQLFLFPHVLKDSFEDLEEGSIAVARPGERDIVAGSGNPEKLVESPAAAGDIAVGEFAAAGTAGRVAFEPSQASLPSCPVYLVSVLWSRFSQKNFPSLKIFSFSPFPGLPWSMPAAVVAGRSFHSLRDS